MNFKLNGVFKDAPSQPTWKQERWLSNLLGSTQSLTELFATQMIIWADVYLRLNNSIYSPNNWPAEHLLHLADDHRSQNFYLVIIFCAHVSLCLCLDLAQISGYQQQKSCQSAFLIAFYLIMRISNKIN